MKVRMESQEESLKFIRPPPLKLQAGKGSSSSSSSKKFLASTIERVGPVIIHTYSPKIIQTDAENFMSLVQRLTGSSETRIRWIKAKAGKKKTRLVVQSPSPKSSLLINTGNQAPDSFSCWSPIPTPNFILQQEDLPSFVATSSG